jgi:RimJ/RimL family protein N-acetyltransferase
VTERVRLRDGTNAVIRPLLPTDREVLREQYEYLSPESRFHRFLAGVPHLTETMLERLVDDVDGIDHVALVLLGLPEDDGEVPAGIARIVRYQDRLDTADVAVTVTDEWQGRGVASALLEALIRRRPEGIRQILTRVAVDNPASLALLRRLGDLTVRPAGDGCLDVVIDLPDLSSTAT